MKYYGFKSVAKFPRSNLKNLGFANGMAQVIKSLFANNEQGFAFDFNDLSTMYQDAAGTIPVTGVGQPVGLVLDKSKGLVLGGNLSTDPTFSNPAQWSTNKTQETSIANNKLIFNNTPAFNTVVSNNLITTTLPGQLYKLSFVISDRVSGSVRVQLAGGAILNTQAFSTNGVITLYVFATAAHNIIGFQSTVTGTTLKISELKLQEIPGNHATQPTSAKRPLLKSSPTQLNYDGIDDVMTVNLPAQLTGCTLIRAIPNVGTQILTNQTISAPYSDSTTNSGLIVVNRALTSEETTRVTQVFNKLAGV